MKHLKSILLTLVGVFFASSLFAHALWMETKSTGKKGQAQEVKVFYGEYAQNERDETGKWYSDVKELSLWMIGPDQKKVKLNTTLGANVAIASFTPETDGQYTLLVSHEAKELGGTTKYHFLTSTTVQVGKPAALVNGDVISNELKVFPVNATVYEAKKAVKLKAVHNNELKAGATVSVFSPAGWSQVLTTDKDGQIEFTPLWPGRYVVEVTDFKNTKGQHNGAAYEAVWLGSTYSFEVN
jgi:uncharacterized GH25 family protein